MPRRYAFLSDEAREAMRQLWASIGRHGHFPMTLSTTFAFMVPKQGGVRWQPIGLLSPLLRIVDRNWRRFHAGAWLRTDPRPYWFAPARRAVEQCAWRQSALAEHATATNQAPAARLLDIAKAYNSVVHHMLAPQALKYGFVAIVLSTILRVYTGPMATLINCAGVASRFPRASVLPGCAFADIMMAIMLVDALDVLTARWPSSHPAIVADDVHILVTGRPESVAHVAASAHRCRREQLDSAVGFTLSDPTTAVVVNDPRVDHAVRVLRPRLRNAIARSAKHIGRYLVGGKFTLGLARKSRLHQVRNRDDKANLLRKACCRTSHLVRQGLAPCRLAWSKRDWHICRLQCHAPCGAPRCRWRCARAIVHR